MFDEGSLVEDIHLGTLRGMSWIRQAEWIKIANINDFKHCKKNECLYL